ncbi:MAG: alpha/beta hydrolase [Patescibacteria group bacterium]
METKVIIIHGNQGGTGNDCWIPWLRTELEKEGFEVLNPTMPDNETAKSSLWLPYIENELKTDENTILVGWSSGAVAAMRYAETHKILGSVLIGACYTDLGDDIEKVSGYYDEPWQWDTIRKNQEWIVQFGSVDDPVIPIEESRFVSEKLNSEYTEFTDKKHFGWPDPMDTFPELLTSILQKTKQANGQ